MLGVKLLLYFFSLLNRKLNKESFSHSKGVLKATLPLTVLSNCVSGSSNFDTFFLPNFTVF